MTGTIVLAIAAGAAIGGFLGGFFGYLIWRK